MQRHATIFVTCCALLGIGMASATAADAAMATAAGAAVAKPAGYSIVSSTFSLPAGRQTPGSVVCPVKNGVQTVPFDGGVLIQNDSSVANINSSYPTTNGWATNVNNADVESQATVYAVCATKPAGYQVRSKTIPNPADTATAASIACARGKVLIGGGSLSSSSSLIVNLNSSFPGTTGWFVTMDNPVSPSATVTLFSVCAKLNLSKISYQMVAPPGVDNPSHQLTATEATCPSGLSLLAGGVRSNGGLGVTTNASFPFTGGWIGDQNNNTLSDASVDTLVICAS
jgi:hypothetical protein